MMPPAERFKNTTNRMIANKDKKVGIAPPTINGKSVSQQASSSSGGQTP
jgi:hypothetical protein